MRTRQATSVAAALAVSAVLGLPAASQAAAGSLAPDAASTPAAPAGGGGLVAPQPGQPTLNARPYALLGRSLALSGTVGSRGANATISIQRQDARTGWVTVARTTAGARGAFSAIWRANRSGRIKLRAITGAATAVRSATGDAPAQTLVTVYRSEISTWYGGPWGSRTACGVILRKSTVGVAHRTLPCGTQVEIFYRGRSMSVPVIDRGPYANNANWDLTQAVAQQLGFDGVERIGVLVAR
jgi:rare lipoprotein A